MMTTAPLTTTAVALVPPLSPKSPIAAARPAIRTAWPQARRSCVSCQVALTTEVPSSSSLAEEEAAAVAKVGARVRVTEPVKIYHVSKATAPELDLRGMEGTIKQYVGVWKGKCISANLPFKVEFLLPVNGEPKPVKFFAHLKDDEFEYLPSSD